MLNVLHTTVLPTKLQTQKMCLTFEVVGEEHNVVDCIEHSSATRHGQFVVYVQQLEQLEYRT